MNINQVLKHIKKDFEAAVRTAKFNGKKYQNGNKAKEALIRSQRLINYIHEFIKQEFIANKINPKKIFPPLNAAKPEIKIEGFLKAKNQDITILPNPKVLKIKLNKKNEVEKIITTNIRSQLSSLAKNIDTLYERTFAEALNLHLKYSKQCLGEVYLIPTHEYDDKSMVYNQVKFKKASKIEEYVNMFQAINKRTTFSKDAYKYERVCLLIVDFRKNQPKLYSNVKELIADNLVDKNTKITLKGLTVDDFVEDLLRVYSQRFNLKLLH